MAADDFTNTVNQSEIAEIGGRLMEIAAQLAGFKPTLDMHLDDVDEGTGNSLALVGGLAEYLTKDIGILGERLEAISGKQI